jgi:hypothetical protein
VQRRKSILSSCFVVNADFASAGQRSYRELDILFERRVAAKKFRSEIVDEEDES